MNIMYIIFIIIILFSFITGLFVTIAENREKKKYTELLKEESIENEESTSEIEDNNFSEEITPIENHVEVQNNNINENNGVDYTPNIESPVIPKKVDNVSQTNPLDNIEVLDNTIKLDFIPTKNNNKKHVYNSTPKLVPYSVVDDDII